jgi:hypothetical protein
MDSVLSTHIQDIRRGTSIIKIFLYAEIERAIWVRFPPFARETLTILFMLLTVSSEYGCAHAPKLSDIRDFVETSQQLFWEWHPNRRLHMFGGWQKPNESQASKASSNELWRPDAILREITYRFSHIALAYIRHGDKAPHVTYFGVRWH